MRHPIVKRVVDIAGAIIGIAVFSPFAPFIMLAITLDSPGPVVVRLPRVSRGRTVGVYKFRSMVAGADTLKHALTERNERDGPFFKIKNDPRLTRVGRFIRRFRLDEFPQLLNVLRGELSLVGPRPHEPAEVAAYPAPFSHIPRAVAGVTGLSQVSGASSLPFLRELALDDEYLRRQSLGLDVKIIGKTLAILLFDPTAV